MNNSVAKLLRRQVSKSIKDATKDKKVKVLDYKILKSNYKPQPFSRQKLK